MQNVYKTFIGKPKGKRPLRKPRHRWEDNIRLIIREIWCEGVDTSDSQQGPVAGSCEYGNEPPGSIKSREFLD
jgi:hypothetical protein